MDWDKLTIFIKTLGFPIVVAIWFMWKVQGALEQMVVSQAVTVELLRQLLEVHK